MEKGLKFILIFVGIVSGLLFTARFLATEKFEQQKLELKQTNIFSEADKIHLSMDTLRGKNLVVNLWATWCGPCIREIPELNALKEKYRGKNVNFIALSSEDETEAMEEKGIDFRYSLVYGKEQFDFFIQLNKLQNYQGGNFGRVIPVHIIINEKGQIEQYLTGNKKENIEIIDKYLAGL